jgi:4-hydroxybenzoate polyprenyltransferase
MWTDVRRIGYCLVEARPVVQVIFLMRFTAGVLLCGQASVQLSRVLVGALGWAFATIAVYLFNGVADRVEDVANGSSRPIARGDLPVGFAVAVTVVSAGLGCVLAVSQGTLPTIAMLGYLVLGYAYSGPPFPLKLTFYTASVGGGALGFVTYLGGAVSGGHRPGAGLLVFATAMSVWMGGVGGIAKDLSDVAGDRLAGRRTWPVVFGEQLARRMLMAEAGALAVVFGIAALLYSTRLLWCAGAVLLGAIAVAAVSAHPPADADRLRRRLPYRAFMWTQYLSHAVLVGVVVVAR